ncbi:MAG TPA: thiamine pyrophosphate-dependent enzyme [Dehalococcoidia bacterium]|nr:thiamine pyrophosphate-dependent enzyme [Dehalococcoidia bacterium]
MAVMQRNDTIRALAEQREGAVCVATMTVLEPFREASPSELNIGCVGFMGGASGLGLGLALSQPDRKVLVLDGDGSLLMQLGSLATISGAAAPNYYHFLFHNGVYETSGSQAIPAEGRIDFAGMARAAGYHSTHRFDDLEELRTSLHSVLLEEGPVFVELLVEPAGSNYRGGARSITFEEEARHLKEALLRSS